MSSIFINNIRDTIKKYNMIEKQDRVLVGLSGGADSVALLHVLCKLKEEYGLDIHVAHLDHRFRGDESSGDRKFCEGLAGKLNLDFIYEEVDVPNIVREKGGSAEEVAREVRYSFFKRAARLKNIKKIAVGHTKDDQTETVLMRLVRGSGMSGLGGMHPVKDIQGFTIIRPFIEVSKKDINDFVKEAGLEFRHDSSNDKVMFTRNRVRHELIPYIEQKFNPNIKNVLADMAENLREENDFLERFAKRKLKAVSKINKFGEIVIDIKKIKRQPEAVRKRILRCALESLKGNLRRFRYQHWKEMEKLIDERPGNSIVDLPGNIDIIKNKTTLTIRDGS